jgi:hypothetical protein
MHFDNFSFGTLRIDSNTYEEDVVIDRGEVGKRKKAPSSKFLGQPAPVVTRGDEIQP